MGQTELKIEYAGDVYTVDATHDETLETAIVRALPSDFNLNETAVTTSLGIPIVASKPVKAIIQETGDSFFEISRRSWQGRISV